MCINKVMIINKHLWSSESTPDKWVFRAPCQADRPAEDGFESPIIRSPAPGDRVNHNPEAPSGHGRFTPQFGRRFARISIKQNSRKSDQTANRRPVIAAFCRFFHFAAQKNRGCLN